MRAFSFYKTNTISIMFYLYIIYSKSADIYYKGITENPENRLFQHNNNLTRYSADKAPWMFVFLKEVETKKEVLIQEKRIKKLNRRSLELLINSTENNLKKILNQI